jgi:epoxyqueuosine reductase
VRLIEDPSPLVRAMAVWATARLVAPDTIHDLAAAMLPGERDQDVRAEWQRALEMAGWIGAAA